MNYSLQIRQLLQAEATPSTDWPRHIWSLRQAGQIVLAGIVLGLIYPVFGDGFSSIVPYVNGLLIGLLGGVGISVMELYISKYLRKRVGFLFMVCTKISLYTIHMLVCVVGVIVVSRSIQFKATLYETVVSDAFRHFILYEDFVVIVAYALVFVSVVIFTMEISRKMGQGILFNFVTGRYFRPRSEHRIFMFLDLNSSVTYAEHLGDLTYHNLLNDFVRDFTPGILKAKGKIHQYVGDEVVVSWLADKKTEADQSLLAFLYCFHAIRGRKSYYQKQYGVVPSFKAAFHCGDVISGEIGEIKSEIVFHGDVVNTTARMERLCTELGESLLISQPFFERLSAATREMFKTTGSVRLRGKHHEMQVFSLVPGTILTTAVPTTLSA